MKRLLLLFTICISSVSFGQVPNYVPTNGLVGWWGFNGNANDESGNGNNGTVNGATLTTDRFGNPNSAYNFDGNDWISLPNIIPVDKGTTAFWFTTNDVSASQVLVYHSNFADNGFGVMSPYMQTHSAVTVNGHYFIFDNNAGTGWVSNTTLNINSWYHMVLTFDKQDSARCYINGVLVNTTDLSAETAGISPTMTYIGRPGQTTRFLDGKFDDFGIWNRALTQCEISELYHAQQLTPPALTLSDTTSACGASTTLDAGTDPSWASYLWNTAEDTQTISVSNPGLYTVEVTDTSGCIGYDTTLVSIIDPTIDQIDTNICIGDSLVLEVCPTGNSCMPLPANLQNGLVAHYPFCGNANDESGYGNDGTVNGATLTTDRFCNENSAYYFDGVDDWINIGNPIGDQPVNMTLSIWVKDTLLDLDGAAIIAKKPSGSWLFQGGPVGDGGTGGRWQISFNSTGIGFCFDSPEFASCHIISNSQILLNWTNVILTEDNDSLRFYINGLLLQTFPSSNNTQENTDITIGRRMDALTPGFVEGIIDDVSLWNRALTPSEVQQLYEFGNYDITWSTGDTTSSITVQPTTSTTYTVTVSDGISSCTDDVTITVNDPQVDAGVDVDVCNGDDITLSGTGADTYVWSGGVTDGVAFGPTVSEYYYVTGTDTLGCEDNDSVFVTVLQPTTSSITETVCDSYSAPDGQIYTTTGNYTAVIPNAVGCDSTITIDLTITNSNTGSETVTECDSYTWSTNGQTYTQTGQYTEVLTNQVGCDSTVTLNLTITNSNAGSETVTECNSYTWNTNGQTYTQSGQYTEVLTNQVGCDSTVTLNLTINSSSSSTQTDSGVDSYTWSVNNQTYTQSGTYTAVVPNASGCDSTITLDLTLQFTGLDENETSYVAVYPNPTFNTFTLSTKDMIHMNYTLLDIQGKLVLTGKIESTEETVDISKLSKGQYNLVFEDENISPISIIKN